MLWWMNGRVSNESGKGIGQARKRTPSLGKVGPVKEELPEAEGLAGLG